MRIALITPALSDANNGNWQTAQRWAAMLSTAHTVELAKSSDTLSKPLSTYDTMIALHAKRSAASVESFATQCPGKPLWVVLTGTDLYRDIAHDANAQQSLQCATQLIVLQEHGVLDLPEALRHKVQVVFQSAPSVNQTYAPIGAKLVTPSLSSVTIPALAAATEILKICVVGHLRSEKSPETTLALAHLLAQKSLAARIQHVGKVLDDQYTALVQATQAACPQHYGWLGGLDHVDSLNLIAQSDVLLHPSAMEGGALAIIEAIQAGKAVVASRVAGHIGLLGADYLGFFEWGDAHAAFGLLQKFANDAAFKTALLKQCAARSTLFNPEYEQRTLLNLLSKSN